MVDNRGISDPYINLAAEEYLVRNLNCESTDYLFLYVNEPCVVLGKNQSIYKEINFDYLRRDKLKFARRISGGGTVYHDFGNLNFTFISKFADEKINNYIHFNQQIINALNKVGVPATMDERNNIVCNGLKISGNAQFTNRKNILSHGTLLFSAELNALGGCLKENDFSIETRAPASKKSPVANIKSFTNQFHSVAALQKYLASDLKADNVFTIDNVAQQAISEMSDKFRSYEWIYGRSPKTLIKKGGVELTVDDGIIISISGINATSLLLNRRYEYNEIKKALEMHPNASEILLKVF